MIIHFLEYLAQMMRWRKRKPHNFISGLRIGIFGIVLSLSALLASPVLAAEAAENGDVPERHVITKYGTPLFQEVSAEAGTEEPQAADPMMGVGQTGEDVAFVQEMLNILGYSSDEGDGVYSTETESSVREFQQDHALYVDGLVGPLTMSALIDETYKNPDRYTGLVQMPTSGRWAFVCNGLYTDDPSEMVLTTEDEEAGLKEEFCEVYAKNVVDRITNPGMTEEEKINACFQFTMNEFESTNHPRVPHYTGSDWVYVYAYDMFGPRHGGNCFSYAAAFSVLAKACGIEEVYCCTSGAHAWTEIDGLVYDPEQYHDTDTNKIYAYSYQNPAISNYWPAISSWEDNPWMRMKLPAFS